MNILLGVSGSVAATLTSKLKVELALQGHFIGTVVTNSALEFKAPNNAWGDIYQDENEWHSYKEFGKVLHIELIKWADAFLIAPCTANTLAKMANGMADNLLTSCALAWNFEKPFLVAPAMNSLMICHPATRRNLQIVSEFGCKIVPPIVKKLYCGDYGEGAMARIEDIISEISDLSK